MNVSEYSQGICEDGAAILRDGQPMTVEEILDALRDSEKLQAEVERLRAESERRQRLYIECETDNTSLINERQKLKRQSNRLKAQINGMKQASEKERDQLKAYCDRLRTAALNAVSMMPGGNTKATLRDAYDETPAQCLAAHDAEVIEQVTSEVDRMGEGVQVVSVNSRWLRDYASQLRQGVKEVQS